MSANNFILISKSKYTVKECDAEVSNCVIVKKGKSLLDAIGKAQKIQENEIIEYGIHFEE